MAEKGLTLQEVAQHIDAEVKGDAACRVFAINTILDAKNGEIAFLSNPKYHHFLKATSASAIILSPETAEHCPCNAIVTSNPYLGFARIAQLLDSTPNVADKVDSKAFIHPEATVDPSVCLGANVVIESGVVIEAGVQIGANSVIGKNSKVGECSKIYPNVTVYHAVQIGKRAIIHSGSVIGSDGFGFANDKGQWVKIPQVGGVLIGDDFECGANCTIDRGAILDTIIGDDVKLDNLCHIAHNVNFGSHSAMAAYSGVAGSTKVGEYCTFSGRVSVIGHLEIESGSHVTVGTVVTKSLEKGAYSSGSPMMSNKEWKRNTLRFRQLDDMAKTIKRLEKEITQLRSENTND